MKKKIVITGANGFLGRNLVKWLSKNDQLEIIPLTRKELDLTNTQAVYHYFADHYNQKINTIIHCAVEGGRRIKQDTPETLYNNLLMFDNLKKCQNYYTYFINLGSGAEDRWLPTYYGLAKRYISYALKDMYAYNLKLYNVFGDDEEPQRFMRANIERYIRKEPQIIHKDRYMDFFYIDDFCRVIEQLIKYKLVGSGDLTYEDEKTLSLTEISKYINTLFIPENYVYKLESTELDSDYKGNNSVLKYLYLKNDILGIKKGIKKMYSKLMDEFHKTKVL